jgi:hypothetical protein
MSPEMVASYNHTVHKTIGIPPAEVTWANQTTVSKRLYGRKGPTKSCKFSPKDRVRLNKANGFGLLVVSGKEVHVVFLEKCLKYSVGKFSSFGYL